MPDPHAFSRAFNILIDQGWQVSHAYADGAIRFAKDDLGLFLADDGRITRPTTTEGQIALSNLTTAGLSLKES